MTAEQHLTHYQWYKLIMERIKAANSFHQAWTLIAAKTDDIPKENPFPKLELNTMFDKWKSFVDAAHGGQLRKYTNLPYTTHLQSVVDILHRHAVDGLIIKCAAYGHDLLEDTDVSSMNIWRYFKDANMDADGVAILHTIQELTDVYTPEAYPMFNRAKRKELEAYRLWGISPIAQTIKYADLIDNMGSILEHDEEFARVYVQEKHLILQGMHRGQESLYKEALSVLWEAQRKLGL